MNKLKTAWSCPVDTNPMDPSSLPDITLRLSSKLGDGKDFQVNLKIVDSRPGNTDISASSTSGAGGVRGLDAKGVVALPGSGGGSAGGSAGEVNTFHFSIRLWQKDVQYTARRGTGRPRSALCLLKIQKEPGKKM